MIVPNQGRSSIQWEAAEFGQKKRGAGRGETKVSSLKEGVPTIQIRVSDNHNLLVGNIRRIMADRGLKQYYVAERAGFEKKTFNAMLRGRKIIRAEYIPLIISALGEGVSANDLYRTDKD